MKAFTNVFLNKHLKLECRINVAEGILTGEEESVFFTGVVSGRLTCSRGTPTSVYTEAARIRSHEICFKTLILEELSVWNMEGVGGHYFQ